MAPLPGMGDFTRVIWSSKAGAWKDKIKEISQAWQLFEFSRPYFIINVKASELANVQKAQIEAGKDFVLLGAVNDGVIYSNNIGEVDYSKLFSYRVLVGKNLNGVILSDEVIGKLLGYPDCCVKFFNRWWDKEKLIDLTWPAWQNSNKYSNTCNVMLRYLGLRAIHHLPCSFSCIESNIIAHRNWQKFKETYPEQADNLRDILQWPLHWSAVNGIVEIKFPLGKIIARTDYYDTKKEIEFVGSKYPEEGESGISFPYNQKKILISKPVEFIKKEINTDRNANGFTNQEKQNKAHFWLSSELARKWDIIGNYLRGTFIDLGAGNGDLIKHLEKIYPMLKGVGVDNKNKNEHVIQANINDLDNIGARWTLALIAEQRFTDTFKSKEEALQYLSKFVDNVFVYNYETRETTWQSFSVNKM